MSNRNILDCSIILGILFLLGTSSICLSQELEIKIYNERDQYYLHENIFILVSMKNKANEVMRVNSFITEATLHLELKDDNGNVYKPKQITDYMLSRSGFPLSPSTEIYKYICINKLYGIQDPETLTYYLPKGTYRLRAKYRFNPGIEQEPQFILSDIVTFEVVRPSREENIVLQRIIEGNKAHLNRDFERAYEINEQIIKDNPESKYIQTAYYEILYLNKLIFHNSEEYVKYAKTFIKENPNAPYSCAILARLNAIQRDKTRSFMMELQNEFPNSMISKYIDGHNYLQSLRN